MIVEQKFFIKIDEWLTHPRGDVDDVVAVDDDNEGVVEPLKDKEIDC